MSWRERSRNARRANLRIRQYTDTETGLIYLRARYYDPSTAQFLTVDPLVAQTRSAYGYVDNNPLNGTDPTGLTCIIGLFGDTCPTDVGHVIVRKIVNGAASAGEAAARAAVDVVAVIPYAVYYGSYEAARGINAVGSQFGPGGSAVSHVVAAPLAIPEALGLGTDVGIDAFKNSAFGNESTCDEGKTGFINPLHGFLPGPLKGPQVYLPGIHSNGSIDFQW